jgi:hypothetical protein
LRGTPELRGHAVPVEIKQAKNAVIDEDHVDPRPDPATKRINGAIPAFNAGCATLLACFRIYELLEQRDVLFKIASPDTSCRVRQQCFWQ